MDSFDDALNKHKRLLTESLINFYEGQRVRKIMLDIDSNSADYEYYFQSGQQYKQYEVDELRKRVKELELINFDSELHFDAAKEHIDRLQKMIGDAWMWCEKGCILKAMEILKGEQTK